MAKRPTYPPEFRRRIVELVRSGRSVSSVAVEFQVVRQSIMNWIKQEDLDTGRRTDGLTSEEHQELTQLRKRVKVLEEEKIILKKAAADSRGQRNTTPMTDIGGIASGSYRTARSSPIAESGALATLESWRLYQRHCTGLA